MRKLILVVAVLAGMSSCGSYKSLAYLQDVNSGATEAIAKQYTNTARGGDILSIVVSSAKPELAIPYNLFAAHSLFGQSVQYSSNAIRSEMEGYTVGANGTIDFPSLGEISVAGLTREEIAGKIKAALLGSVPDAVVTVSFVNFRITVAGEVNRPGVYNVYGDRITLLEALGMAGDLTTYGRRTNILVVREVDGNRTFAQINLKTKELFQSDFYYLQQNDVIYVEPVSAKARTVSTFTTNFPMVVSITSLASTILMGIYYISRIN